MAVKDYYLVLGVGRHESTLAIRRAYRDLAKRFHPDRAGESQTSTFRDIAEAYGVLSDPKRRRSHNRELAEAAAADRLTARGREDSTGITPVSSRPRAEPAAGARIDIGWLQANRPLELIVTLSHLEAARGGIIHVGVPIRSQCRSCLARRFARWLCQNCGGLGLERHVRPIAITIPKGVSSGTTIDARFDAAGIDTWIRVRVYRR